MFIAKTWNNGSHHPSGAGYGFKIRLEDREKNFNPKWHTVILHLYGQEKPIEVNVAKHSFWSRTCGELISKDISIWLIRRHKNRWPFRQPYDVNITVIADREFKVKLIN